MDHIKIVSEWLSSQKEVNPSLFRDIVLLYLELDESLERVNKYLKTRRPVDIFPSGINILVFCSQAYAKSEDFFFKKRIEDIYSLGEDIVSLIEIISTKTNLFKEQSALGRIENLIRILKDKVVLLLKRYLEKYGYEENIGDVLRNDSRKIRYNNLMCLVIKNN